jgi:hypothetical protein
LAYKNLGFLYTNNEHTEKETGKLFIHTSFKKYLRIGILVLAKELKDFHNENYKTLKKETEEDLRNGKTSNVHGSTELIV